ncbi:MAG TPA: hypothetical protein H9734_10025, partial [Candidatus Fusicatenibacter merdavium]|nr:hypothetical protein [Candidatus Fusicatenibacter merdavium]
QNFRGCVSLFSYQGSLRFSGAVPASAATPLVYHSELFLSRTFLKYFLLFVKKSFIRFESLLSSANFYILSHHLFSVKDFLKKI